MSRLPRLSAVPLLILAAAIAIGFLAVTSGRKFAHDYHLRADKADLQLQVEELDREEQELTAVRDYLKSDEYVEDVARRVLGLVRPGETLVVVSSSVPRPASAPTPERSSPRPWWRDLFGDAAAEATPTPH